MREAWVFRVFRSWEVGWGSEAARSRVFQRGERLSLEPHSASGGNLLKPSFGVSHFELLEPPKLDRELNRELNPEPTLNQTSNQAETKL